ncbi:centrosomal protein of 152 kDa [Colossoma macropomum]|uniref:centrosomal protein of 152 kDa n=1 Tax=Colossoma macropomum TaxID=42526 RepID=UPI00186456D3|nr:centrosomal protein of 152 kDa [Colossoma macropomum]
MSIDFDSAALQTQHDEEEEYDQEDYAREQELHKLLTDLPDDMLEDSRDCSSPELDYSTCSHQGDNRSHSLNAHHKWSNQPGAPPAEEGYTYDSTASQPNSHADHLRGGTEHLPHAWDPHQGQNYQYESDDCVYSSAETAESNGINTLSTEEGYEQEAYPHSGLHHGAEYHGAEAKVDAQVYGEHVNVINHFQNFDNGISERKAVDCYKATFRPHNPTSQPKMFNTKSSAQNDNFDQLQRDFLDSSPSTLDAQEYAQLKILNKAQSRQIEDLEQNLEDSRRKMRYLEHQFAIVKDEKEGLTISLKESSRLIEEAKERESQLQGKVRSLERQIHSLTEREQENMKKQRVAEAAVDSMQQQMMELCRSDTLTRTREQHDRDMAAIREQHEARVLALQQKQDSLTQSLEEQVQAAQRLREQVRQLERQREEEQVDRATVINALTQRLEESQQQCAKLLQTGSVQEMSQMQIKLQQAQSSRNISENMNKALQEELSELKEQITLYESAVKLGAVSFDSNTEWENQLSESYIDLGIKKVNWKNSRNHSTPVLPDSSLPKEDLVRELKIELQRCLSQLKTKRQKISQLQEELRTSQNRMEQLQTQLDGVEMRAKDSVVRESSLEKLLEPSNTVSQKELIKLEEERQNLQKRVEALEVRNKELKQSEEKVKAANSELCTKMREMIQELDLEKQEAAERYERVQQQYRDDVVQRVRAELTQERTTHVEQLTTQHEQQIKQLESKLAELSQEVLAVQECYISVCKEKDKLEENLQSRIVEEKKLREKELRRREETEMALERLKAELLSQHQETVTQLEAQWTEEKETEVQMQVAKQLTSAKQSWQQEKEELEKNWELRLEEAMKESQKAQAADTQEGSSQTDYQESAAQIFSMEQLEARLDAQRVALQREADSNLSKAVEDALRQKERELQQKHVQDMTLQVEGAVSRAHARWLQDLTSLPEYKASQQTEREKWEAVQEQNIQEQVSSAIKTAEDKWQKALSEKRKELEDYVKRNQELQDQVRSLNTQLERSSEEHTALLKAELSAARAMWSKDKQQEVSCLKMQLKAQLEKKLEQAREEAFRQGQEDLQKTLRSKEESWRSQQEIRLREEQQQVREDVLAEIKEVLKEIQDLSRGGAEERGSREGGLRAKLKDMCRDALYKAVAHSRQEWEKSSEDKLRRVLKETQEQHEKELGQIRSTMAQGKEGVCNSKGCTESVAKLQKKNQDLQRHLEKACRQLQHTVREHKSTLHTLKEEHDETLRKEKEAHTKALEKVKLSACKESCGADNQNLQAGLEEMKEQYMKAVQKIRGDMLRYLQESKERAAELIRVEVLRERQDTARRMRRYYLTCLQELLEEGGQTTGAEKKIINAASKLAAMAKVLETPVAKKRLQRNQNVQDLSLNAETSANDHAAKVSAAASSQSLSFRTESRENCKNEQTHQICSVTELECATQKSKLRGIAPAGEVTQLDFKKSVRADGGKGPEVTKQVTPVSPLLCNPKPPGDFASYTTHIDVVSNANVTFRKQSREMYLMGTESGKAKERLTPQVAVEPFLIEEAPVRDNGQSDWSLSSNGSTFTNNIHLTTSYPSKNAEPVRPFSLLNPSVDDLDFGSCLGDNSDVTVYKEIVKKPSYVKPKQRAGLKSTKSREPTPGSEGEKIHRLCPKSLFSELKICQQDSGFDSPLSLIQK